MAGTTIRSSRVLCRTTKISAIILGSVIFCAASGLSWAGNGTLRVCDDVQDPASLDPYAVFSEKVHTVLQQMLEGLVRFDPDGHLEPALAVSWERMDDLRMRFHLRRGVRFQDGEPFNAASVKFSLEKYVDPRTHYPGLGFVQTISSVSIVDDHTVDVITHVPDGLLLNRLAAWLYIVPKDYFQRVGPQGFSSHPIGTGPFQFAHWTSGKEIALAANKSYWSEGEPKVDRLIFRFIPLDDQVKELLRGNVDLITDMPGTMTTAVVRSERAKVIKKASLYTFTGSFRTESGPLADVRVRRAFNLAINREDLIRYDALGNGIPLATVTMRGEVGHDSALRPYPYDPKKAKVLLAEAGYPKGFHLRAFVKSQAERPFRIIKKQLEAIGVILDGEIVTDRDMLALLQEKSWDMTFGDCPDPMVNSFFIQAIVLDSHSPFSLMHSREYDRRLEEFVTSMDPEKQSMVGKRLDDYIYDNSLCPFTYQRIRTYGMRKNLHFEPSITGMPYFFTAYFSSNKES